MQQTIRRETALLARFQTEIAAFFQTEFRHFGNFYLDTVPDVVYDAKCDHKPFHCYLTYKELRRNVIADDTDGEADACYLTYKELRLSR